MIQPLRTLLRPALAAPVFMLALLALAAPAVPALPTAEEFARQVTITRDTWGVPHIEGPTDASVAFGFGYVQSEDYFWQLEDSFITALGRQAEVNGSTGLENDLINRTYEINKRAQSEWDVYDPHIRDMAVGFTMGINWFLKHNPGVKPRLLTHFEPWFMLAFDRQIVLSLLLYDKVPIGKGANAANLEEWRNHVGSNAWAIGPSRTKSGGTMVLANPHQPLYGAGQFTEAHLKSGEGMNVSGATFFGSFVISIGHNEHLGWSHTVNEPNIADAWIVTFDHPDDPLKYKYDGEWRTATEWEDTVKVAGRKGEIEERTYKFRKTHLGPIAGKVRGSENQYYAVGVANLYTSNRAKQWLEMGKATNFTEFKDAMRSLSVPMFNTIYGDRDGNIWYFYNGAVPIRELGPDWHHPVDGSTSKTAWKGIHPLDELPQVLNPPSDFIQNCNSSPFTTADEGNPFEKDFPSYMVKDRFDDKRRAKLSRYLLREMKDMTHEQWQAAAFDTTLYWPMMELKKYADLLESYKDSDPEMYKKVKPYMDHLMDWDFKVTVDSTQATLCVDWYDQLYSGFYPKENFAPEFQFDRKARLAALIPAADNLRKRYGSWKVPYGEIHRMQRVPNVAFGSASDAMKLRFKDDGLSYPLIAAPGPLGVAFTMYYAPPLFGFKKRYCLVGSSFMGAWEFTKDGVKSATLLNFGQSGVPDSPHFMDQAELWGKPAFKPAWFYPDEIAANTKRKYHPGE